MDLNSLERKISAIIKEACRKKTMTEKKIYCQAELDSLAVTLRSELVRNRAKATQNNDLMAVANCNNAYSGLRRVEQARMALARSVSEAEFNQSMKALEKIVGKVNGLAGGKPVVQRRGFLRKMGKMADYSAGVPGGGTPNGQAEMVDILSRMKGGKTVEECLAEDMLAESNGRAQQLGFAYVTGGETLGVDVEPSEEEVNAGYNAGGVPIPGEENVEKPEARTEVDEEEEAERRNKMKKMASSMKELGF